MSWSWAWGWGGNPFGLFADRTTHFQAFERGTIFTAQGLAATQTRSTIFTARERL
jgi:hypothetical protein